LKITIELFISMNQTLIIRLECIYKISLFIWKYSNNNNQIECLSRKFYQLFQAQTPIRHDDKLQEQFHTECEKQLKQMKIKVN